MRCSRHLLFCTFICLAFPNAAQNEHAKWYFGILAGLDFMTIPPTPILNSAMAIGGPCANICNASGTLLFYTDANTIWNANNVPMANGTGLLAGGANGDQCVLIAKKPLSQSEYYVFTIDGKNVLKYSIVDMVLAAGLGSVTAKNVTFSATKYTRKICGAYHCNGKDIWIVTHEEDTNLFLAYLLTSGGLNTNAIASNEGFMYDGGIGAMKISPSGNKIAIVGSVKPKDYAGEVFDFNSTTGLITAPVTVLQATTSVFSTEFSPDGSKLYITRGSHMHQLDLCAGDSAAIVSSIFNLSFPDHTNQGIQLNENGKVYIAPQEYHLRVINTPNIKGNGCNLNVVGPSTLPNQTSHGLPNHFLRYKSTPPGAFTCTVSPQLGCHAMSFSSAPFPAVSCAAANFSVNGVSWMFGEPASGADNVSQLVNPVHYYRAAGQYTVKQVFHYPCGSDTITQVINVPPPHLSVAAAPGCADTGGSATVSVQGGTGPFSYTWLPSQQNTSVAAGLASGLHTVAVFDQGLLCEARATVSLVNHTVPAVQVATLIQVCGGQPATINLSVSNGSFAIHPSAGISTGTGTASIQFPAAQQYSVLAANENCTSQAVFSLTLKPPPVVSAHAAKPRACSGSTVLLTAGGADTYSWLLPDLNQASGATVKAPVPALPGIATYTVTGIDKHGCIAATTVTVAAVEQPSGTLKGFTGQGCAPFCNQVAFLSDQPDSAVTSNWSVAGYKGEGALSFCLRSAGVYTLQGQLTDKVSGCASKVFSVITVHPKPTADFSWSPEEVTPIFDEVHFTGHLSEPGLSATFYFFDGAQTQTVNAHNASFTYPESGIFPVVLTVTDHLGCTDTSIKPLTVLPPHVIYVPNAFSPGNDGHNDVFTPVTSRVSHIRLSIFNRWGQQVFEGSETDTGWDGTHDGKPCKPDVYVWKLLFTTGEGQKTLTGTVALLR